MFVYRMGLALEFHTLHCSGRRRTLLTPPPLQAGDSREVRALFAISVRGLIRGNGGAVIERSFLFIIRLCRSSRPLAAWQCSHRFSMRMKSWTYAAATTAARAGERIGHDVPGLENKSMSGTSATTGFSFVCRRLPVYPHGTRFRRPPFRLRRPYLCEQESDLECDLMVALGVARTFFRPLSSFAAATFSPTL